MIDKGIRYEVQGGVKNYLGKQKEVKAPVKWKSSPDHPETELAYITKAEKDLLIKSDLHGSLKGSVNKGPSGIISLNGWGDASDNFGTGSTAGPGDTGGEGGDSPQDQSTSQFGGQTNFGGSDDRREQYSVTRTQTPIKEEVKVAPISEPERDTGLERQRLKNIALVEDLKKTTYEDLDKNLVPPYIPYSGAINTVGNLLGSFGFEKNKDFFVENVAGKYGYGYGLEDYEQYMEDRLSGKVGAYGNEAQGQNALRQPDDRQDTASGILEALLIADPDSPLLPTSPTGFTYVPYSNQVVVAPGSQGLASLTGGQGFLSSII
jgi:hypothetical protein